MNILITGGAGFIGSAVVRHIISETNDNVLVVDSLTYAGNLESLKEVENDPRYRFVLANICDRDSLDAIFSEFKPDAVMHLAAESHVDRSIDGPSAFIDTNITGTYTLLESARHYRPVWMMRKRMYSVSIIFQLMKSTVICMEPPTYSPRLRHMLRVARTLLPKRQAITSYAHGTERMDCQL